MKIKKSKSYTLISVQQSTKTKNIQIETTEKYDIS